MAAVARRHARRGGASTGTGTGGGTGTIGGIGSPGGPATPHAAATATPGATDASATAGGGGDDVDAVPVALYDQLMRETLALRRTVAQKETALGERDAVIESLERKSGILDKLSAPCLLLLYVLVLLVLLAARPCPCARF
jgi:hypothetical protein